MSPRPVIVLVDDDEMHLLVARRAIDRLQLGAEVIAVTRGEEALRVLQLDAAADADAGRVAVVMLDIALPDLTGWEVLERIRGDEALRSVPVVLVTSSDRPEDMNRAYELGANSYLVKRHDPEHPGNDLARAARYWLDHHQGSHPMS